MNRDQGNNQLPGIYKTLWKTTQNIPILPQAFLTFASKSSEGPAYVANGQEDHKTYTNSNEDTLIMTNYCYFESVAQCMGLLRNV